MKARVIVLAVAVIAALGAAWIARAIEIVSGTPEVRKVERTVGSTDVLVAASDINVRGSVRADDFKWQKWPVGGVTPGLITKESQPDAPLELPEDFLYPRAEAPRPSARCDTVWRKYVAGQPTLSKRDPSENANASEISRIGGSQ